MAFRRDGEGRRVEGDSDSSSCENEIETAEGRRGGREDGGEDEGSVLAFRSEVVSL